MEKYLPLIINGLICSTGRGSHEITFEENKVKIDSFNVEHISQMLNQEVLIDLDINNIINFFIQWDSAGRMKNILEEERTLET